MNYKIPKAMQNNALRGLVLANKDGIEIQKDLTKAVIQGEVSLEQIKKLYQILNKTHFDDKKIDLKALSAGGSSGLAFTRKILKAEGILKSYTKEITEAELEVEDKTEINSVNIVKQLNEEKRLATFVVLEPQDEPKEDYETTDLHADWYDEDTVENACINFNRFCRKANILHMMPTTGYEFVESYITKSDQIIGESLVKKGSWVATIYCSDDDIWQGVKDGTFNGLSVQCSGLTQKIKQNEKD